MLKDLIMNFNRIRIDKEAPMNVNLTAVRALGNLSSPQKTSTQPSIKPINFEGGTVLALCMPLVARVIP